MINTIAVPGEERYGGHGLEINVTFMHPVVGVDYVDLIKPYAKIFWDNTLNMFEFDRTYFENNRAMIEKVKEAHRAQLNYRN